MDQYITTQDIALSLNVDKKTVINMLRKGDIPGVKVGRQWRVKLADFNAYIASLEDQYHVKED